MSRNNERVLSDAMIDDIKERMFEELGWGDARYTFVSTIVNAYLSNYDELMDTITEWIETFEDQIIAELNTQLMEDSFNQNENND